jgi:fumarate reductase subunit D
MSVTQHLVQLVLFLAVLVGPIPFSLSLIALVERWKGAAGFDPVSGRGMSLAHSFLLLLTSWCIIETCVVVVLGIIHHFALGAILFSEVAVFAIGMFVRWKNRDNERAMSLFRRPEISDRFNGFEKMIVAAILVVLGFLVLDVTVIPITDYASLRYDFPTMANWYQTSSLATAEEFRFVEAGRYPGSWEAFCTLFMMPFREDFVVAFPNLVAWAIFGLSIYLISVHLGATRIQGLGASSLCLATPLLIYNVNSMHPDFALGSFFMAGLYFSVLYTRTRRTSYLAVFSAILGMLLGIKTSGAFYGCILIVFMASSVIRSHLLQNRSLQTKPMSKQHAGLLFVGGLACFLITGCYWYLKNFLEVGNPFGLVRISIGGLTLFPGPIDPAFIHKTTLAGLFSPTNFSHWKILINQVFVNLGLPFLAMFILFVASLLFLPFVSAHDRSEPRIKAKSVVGLLVLLVITVLLYWNTPYSADNGTQGWQITPWIGNGLRYSFSTIGVLGILAALGATLARVKDQIIVSIVITCGALAVLSTPHQKLVSVFLYTVVGLLLVWSLLNAAGWTRWIASAGGVPRLGAALILIGVVFAASFAARGIRDRYRSTEYQGILEYIENNIGKEQTIGYLLDHRPYLLYGKHFDRKVIYVLPDEAKDRQEQPDSVDHSQWLDTLEKREVRFVAVGPILDAWKSSKELSWIRNDKRDFVHVFGQDTSNETFIYRFERHE